MSCHDRSTAVALIAFRAITHYGVSLKSEWESIVLSFVITGLGSAIMGVATGMIAALSFKYMSMGRRGDLPHVECTIFAAFAYGSFVCAELPENSGIGTYASLCQRRKLVPIGPPVGASIRLNLRPLEIAPSPSFSRGNVCWDDDACICAAQPFAQGARVH